MKLKVAVIANMFDEQDMEKPIEGFIYYESYYRELVFWIKWKQQFSAFRVGIIDIKINKNLP